MTIRSVLLLLASAAALDAQTFIQMSDTQFGMFAKDAGFVHETANFEFAVAAANGALPLRHTAEGMSRVEALLITL